MNLRINFKRRTNAKVFASSFRVMLILALSLMQQESIGLLYVRAQDVKRPVFDVASIKPSPPSVSSYSFHGMSPAMLTISGITVKELIAYAYTLRDYQILNKPKWIDTERFDIAAKDTIVLNSDLQHLSGQQRTAMLADNYLRLQALLADRFQLKMSRTQREMSVHALVVSNGNKLRPVPCSPNGEFYLRDGLIKGPVPMSSLVALLAHDLNGPMIDKTGLTGCFDMDAKWTQSPDEDEDAPAISTALASLGLKLVKVKGPVDLFVIDHVERPSVD